MIGFAIILILAVTAILALANAVRIALMAADLLDEPSFEDEEANAWFAQDARQP
jgi:hypothetical protein